MTTIHAETGATARDATGERPRHGGADHGSPAPKGWPVWDLGRPIRVVVFGGAFFEPAALRFLARLDAQPEIELLGGVCQSRGFDLRSRASNVIRRRGVVAPLVLAGYAGRHLARLLRGLFTELELRRRVRDVLSRFEAVPDIHANEVLRRVACLAPDLGLVYGAPILKPQLFEIPAYGTLGIHHGTLPQYRGKKTTFWAVLNGEPTAGVAIQRINAGLDRGEIVGTAGVSTAGKRYGRIAAEVQERGIALYLETILAVKRGNASSRPQPPARSPLYRQPGVRDIARLWWWQLTRPGEPRWPYER